MRRSRARVLGEVALVAVALVAVAGSLFGTAIAQQDTPEARLREALRRTTTELRALQDQQATQRAALEDAQKQRELLQQQVDLLAAQVAELQPKAQAAAELPVKDAMIDALQQNVATMQANTDALQDAIRKWQAAYQEAVAAVRSKEGEARKLEADLARTGSTLAACEDKNEKLVGVANDVLTLYQSASFMSVWRGSFEPVLGFKRVEFENILQDYQDKVLDQQFFPQAQPAASVPATPAGGAAAR